MEHISQAVTVLCMLRDRSEHPTVRRQSSVSHTFWRPHSHLKPYATTAFSSPISKPHLYLLVWKTRCRTSTKQWCLSVEQTGCGQFIACKPTSPEQVSISGPHPRSKSIYRQLHSDSGGRKDALSWCYFPHFRRWRTPIKEKQGFKHLRLEFCCKVHRFEHKDQ